MRSDSSLVPAAFVDKDGTLIDDVPYNVDPRKIELALGAAEGCRLLAEAGYALVVVSNQSGVARGMFKEQALVAVERRLRELLADEYVPLAGFYFCPHHPFGNVPRYSTRCDCRKPEPGMLLQAAKELRLDMNQSWMIGDILDDVEAGNRAGCRTVFIDSGHETEWRWKPERRPDFVASDMAKAARAILSRSAPAAHPLEALA